jgi:hypothetical protein
MEVRAISREEKQEKIKKKGKRIKQSKIKRVEH